VVVAADTHAQCLTFYDSLVRKRGVDGVTILKNLRVYLERPINWSAKTSGFANGPCEVPVKASLGSLIQATAVFSHALTPILLITGAAISNENMTPCDILKSENIKDVRLFLKRTLWKHSRVRFCCFDRELCISQACAERIPNSG
jgi:hypothetical protein